MELCTCKNVADHAMSNKCPSTTATTTKKAEGNARITGLRARISDGPGRRRRWSSSIATDCGPCSVSDACPEAYPGAFVSTTAHSSTSRSESKVSVRSECCRRSVNHAPTTSKINQNAATAAMQICLVCQHSTLRSDSRIAIGNELGETDVLNVGRDWTLHERATVE